MRKLVLAVGVTALLSVACGGPRSGVPGIRAGAGGDAVPACDEVARISAPEGAYRDAPIYVANEMPVEEVRQWAAGKDGFEDIWIDRDRAGWITVAFSQDAEARQAELAERFPEVGVVAVGVDWTMEELQALQRRVSEELTPLFPHGSGISVTQGVVTIGVGVLTDERVAAVNERFAGERVCLEGTDPADAPSEGPQPTEGEGWRLLADERDVGEPYRTGIATDESSYGELWRRIGLSGERPAVDFETEVVIWFGAVFGSSCPDLRLDDVVVDRPGGLVYVDIVLVDPPAMCTADANPRAYVVAVDRAHLPEGPFAIQLDADGPPAGAPEERTLVKVDLSQPGATAGSDDVGPDPAQPEPSTLAWDAVVEPDVEYSYLLYVHCGIEWLSHFNDTYWRTDVPMPEQWRDAMDEDQNVEVTVILRTSPKPTITATANGHSVVYEPTNETPPGCD